MDQGVNALDILYFFFRTSLAMLRNYFVSISIQ